MSLKRETGRGKPRPFFCALPRVAKIFPEKYLPPQNFPENSAAFGAVPNQILTGAGRVGIASIVAAYFSDTISCGAAVDSILK